MIDDDELQWIELDSLSLILKKKFHEKEEEIYLYKLENTINYFQFYNNRSK